MIFAAVTLILIAYLFGSISSAIIVCRLWRLPDPRTQGSGNPGATNVLRIGGKLPAALTLLGDVLKGVLPVLLAKWIGLEAAGLALVAFAAFFGHLFPLFFRFEGGKGVATALGCLLALAYPVALWWMLTWILIVFIFRYVSLASMVASIATPLFMLILGYPMPYTLVTIAMTLLLIYRHHDNLAKLLSGTEKKIAKRSASLARRR